jgi:ferredoxin
MPNVIVDDRAIEVPTGTRLTLAIERAGIDIGHRCGGKARCTTCRVVFHEGEPSGMTRAEFVRLRDSDLLGRHRLSCQVVVEDDMRVESVMTKQNRDWTDTGPAVDPEVVPEAQWFDRAELEAMVVQ